MSSTNRGNGRAELDQYPTPHWCVHRLLEVRDLPGGVWFEPCAGAGEIIKAKASYPDSYGNAGPWIVNEIDPKYEAELKLYAGDSNVRIGDARDFPIRNGLSVIITNPPFSIAQEILERCLMVESALTIFLQRLNWCAGPRAELFRKLKPSVFVLPNRPSFNGKGTDSIEYAWFVFDGKGTFQMLAETPLEIRREEKLLRRKIIDASATVTVEDLSQTA